MDHGYLRHTTWYEWIVGLMGFLVGCTTLPQLLHTNFFLTCILFALAIVVEIVPIHIGKVSSSLSLSLAVGVAVTYGGGEAVWMLFVAALVSNFIQRTTSLYVAIFNAGQYALSAYVMSRTYDLVAGDYYTGVLTWQTFLGVLAGVVAYLAVNHCSIHIHQVIRRKYDHADVWNMLQPELLSTVISLPFTFFMIVLGPDYPFLAPIVMMPIVAVSQLLRVFQRLSVMHKVHTAMTRLTSEFDVDRIAEDTAKVAQDITFADAVAVVLLDQDQRVLRPCVIYPYETVEQFNLAGWAEDDGGVVWSVLRNQQWEYVPDTRRDMRVSYDGVGDLTYLSMAIFPLHYRGMPQGAIVLYSTKVHAFSVVTEYLSTLASQVSVLIDNAVLHQSLQEQSRRDGATGLYNYRFFYEALYRELTEADKRHTPLSVVVVDVDFFKKFNDTWGHLAGDEVLRSVGALLTERAGHAAIVARYGGEEFGIILPMDELRAYELMEDIRNAVSHHVVQYDGYLLQGITLSIGIASYPNHSTNDRELILKADSAMYWGAKQRGRNRVALYSPDYDAQLFVDGLTGLYTYHFMNIRVREEFARGVRGCSVICMDLDHFSNINNAFGFEVGDMVLKETSRLIRESLRQTELACRYGGDEFLVVLTSVSQAEAHMVADRIQRAVSGHRIQHGNNVLLSVRLRTHVQEFAELEDPAELFERVGNLFVDLSTERKVSWK